MADRNMTLDEAGLDDLPRTLRRQREAKERAGRDTPPSQFVEQHEAQHSAHWETRPEPVPAIVRAIEVPFFRLVLFFLKAVIAAIPALILLTAILFAGGQLLKSYLPGLRHFEIEIRPVGSALDPAPAPRPAPPRK